MAKEVKITSRYLQELEKELNYLQTTREREVAAMIAEARSYGDLSENSEYDAAKNEQAKLQGRIAEIKDLLSRAIIIEDENAASGRASLGCTVLVEDVTTGSRASTGSPAPRKPIPWRTVFPSSLPLAGQLWARAPEKRSLSPLLSCPMR